MEAKVDIRKLQLLNDRINQTIDALNQVRLSVHGLSHTGGLQAQIPGVGYSPFTQLAQGGYGQLGPAFGQGYGQALGGWGGMSHTSAVPAFGAFGGPQQQWGYGPGIQHPLAQNPFLAQVLATNPYFQSGISHTGPDAQWLFQQQQQIDPYYGMRVSQTFPFAQLPLSPVG
jgi:hypothetical protein